MCLPLYSFLEQFQSLNKLEIDSEPGRSDIHQHYPSRLRLYHIRFVPAMTLSSFPDAGDHAFNKAGHVKTPLKPTHHFCVHKYVVKFTK